MKKDFVKQLLKGVEGADDIAQAILDAHGVTVENLKQRHETEVEKANARADKAEKTLKAIEETGGENEGALEKENEELRTKVGTLEKDLTAERDAHAATKTGHEAKESRDAAYKIVFEQFKAKGFPEAYLDDYIKANVDFAELKRDGKGQFANMDKYIEAHTAGEGFAKRIPETRRETADVGNPPNPNEQTEGQFDFNFAAVRPKPKNE